MIHESNAGFLFSAPPYIFLNMVGRSQRVQEGGKGGTTQISLSFSVICPLFRLDPRKGQKIPEIPLKYAVAPCFFGLPEISLKMGG